MKKLKAFTSGTIFILFFTVNNLFGHTYNSTNKLEASSVVSHTTPGEGYADSVTVAFTLTLAGINQAPDGPIPYYQVFWDFGDGVYRKDTIMSGTPATIDTVVEHTYKVNFDPSYIPGVYLAAIYGDGNPPPVFMEQNFGFTTAINSLRGRTPNIVDSREVPPELININFNHAPTPAIDYVGVLSYYGAKNGFQNGGSVLVYYDHKIHAEDGFQLSEDAIRTYHGEEIEIIDLVDHLDFNKVLEINFENLSQNEQRHILLPFSCADSLLANPLEPAVVQVVIVSSEHKQSVMELDSLMEFQNPLLMDGTDVIDTTGVDSISLVAEPSDALNHLDTSLEIVESVIHQDEILAALDPNAISVLPVCAPKSFWPLIFKVEYENIGNSEAKYLEVVLDWDFRMTMVGPPFYYEFPDEPDVIPDVPNGKMRIVFDDIFLAGTEQDIDLSYPTKGDFKFMAVPRKPGLVKDLKINATIFFNEDKINGVEVPEPAIAEFKDTNKIHLPFSVRSGINFPLSKKTLKRGAIKQNINFALVNTPGFLQSGKYFTELELGLFSGLGYKDQDTISIKLRNLEFAVIGKYRIAKWLNFGLGSSYARVLRIIENNQTVPTDNPKPELRYSRNFWSALADLNLGNTNKPGITFGARCNMIFGPTINFKKYNFLLVNRFYVQYNF